jgi:hypothetical protein
MNLQRAFYTVLAFLTSFNAIAQHNIMLLKTSDQVIIVRFTSSKPGALCLCQ